MLLEEFDPERRAVINPDQVVKPVENMPEVAVTCFSRKTFERMLEDLDTEIITWNGTANGEEPVYRAVYKGDADSPFYSGCGSSSECRHGWRKFFRWVFRRL